MKFLIILRNEAYYYSVNYLSLSSHCLLYEYQRWIWRNKKHGDYYTAKTNYAETTRKRFKEIEVNSEEPFPSLEWETVKSNFKMYIDTLKELKEGLKKKAEYTNSLPVLYRQSIIKKVYFKLLIVKQLLLSMKRFRNQRNQIKIIKITKNKNQKIKN